MRNSTEDIMLDGTRSQRLLVEALSICSGTLPDCRELFVQHTLYIRYDCTKTTTREPTSLQFAC
jgi:hypothetical protein